MYMFPLKPQQRTLGRALRIALGVFLLGLFGYALLPGVVFSQHPMGRINAELVTLRAPIDGQVSFSDVRVGDTVRRGQALATLRDPPDRDVRLASLEAQHGSLNERSAGLRQQIAALEPFVQRLGRDSQTFRKAVIDNLSAQIAEAEARVRQAEANVRLLDAQLKRIKPLAAANYASGAELDRRRAEADVAHAELAAQRKAAERLRQERNAAEQGVYLSDSYNNAPYSQQRRDEVELQRLALETRLADLEAERTQMQQQIEAERRRREQVGEAAVQATVDGILWRQLESDGAMIGISAPLLQVADCSRIFFEVPRDRRHEETLSIGDSVTVDFERNGQMTPHQARLVGLRSEQDSDRREFALAGGTAPDQIRWVFAVDFSGSAEACPIGRMGRLRHGDSLIDRIARR
ncbi:HlyD family efflux transporter periplasmic adaptor subunit [Ferrovibrio sp.]|uniref:HlyD family secretion protein n=1 Tax=Ferrovibrio sp. TaxID=1917215 RepID=UPI00262C949B|nr:HlyD family efflux transporter periplasmic adaptor subunit [Ferrovibrio sp.]